MCSDEEATSHLTVHNISMVVCTNCRLLQYIIFQWYFVLTVGYYYKTITSHSLYSWGSNIHSRQLPPNDRLPKPPYLTKSIVSHFLFFLLKFILLDLSRLTNKQKVSLMSSNMQCALSWVCKLTTCILGISK